MNVTLIPIPPIPGKEEELDLTGPRCLIGRSDDCDLRISDRSISRRHAEVFIDDDGMPRLRDLGSRNGTLHNHGELHGEPVLHDGDVVAFGMSSFLVEITTRAPIGNSHHGSAADDPAGG